MKCKHCDGNGGYLDMNRWCFCEQCDGTGQDGLSNDEWRQACSTEEFAKFLYDIRYDYQVPWKNKGVVEWLKQPHQKE